MFVLVIAGIVMFLMENQVSDLQYRGSFEDVFGPIDSYCPSVACWVMVRLYEMTRDERYLDEARRAMVWMASWIRHEPVPWLLLESVGCQVAGTSSTAMMSLAASSLLRHDDSPHWRKTAAAMSYLAFAQRTDPDDPMYGGFDWLAERDPAKAVYAPEWQNCQLIWASRETLINRACRHPRIDIYPDHCGMAFGDRIERVSLEWPGLDCDPVVDYLVLIGPDRSYIVLMNDDGGVSSVRLRVPEGGVFRVANSRHRLPSGEQSIAVRSRMVVVSVETSGKECRQ